MPKPLQMFCPYGAASGPDGDPITCPPGGGPGWRCRALQENGTCIRLEADRALAWILEHCIADCGSRVRVSTRTDESMEVL